jgi:NADPH2:quinone reductase
MKAQVIKKFGDPSVFEVVEVQKPDVIPEHVLIQVKATSVNPIG